MFLLFLIVADWDEFVDINIDLKKSDTKVYNYINLLKGNDYNYLIPKKASSSFSVTLVYCESNY